MNIPMVCPPRWKWDFTAANKRVGSFNSSNYITLAHRRLVLQSLPISHCTAPLWHPVPTAVSRVRTLDPGPARGGGTREYCVNGGSPRRGDGAGTPPIIRGERGGYRGALGGHFGCLSRPNAAGRLSENSGRCFEDGNC